MKAKAALVGADGAVELYAEAAVDLNFALIVKPRNTEFDYSFGLCEHGDNAAFFVFWMPFDNGLKRLENLSYRLVKLGLAGVSFYYIGIDAG